MSVSQQVIKDLLDDKVTEQNGAYVASMLRHALINQIENGSLGRCSRPSTQTSHGSSFLLLDRFDWRLKTDREESPNAG